MSPMSQHTLPQTDISFPFLFCKAFSSVPPLPRAWQKPLLALTSSTLETGSFILEEEPLHREDRT